MKFSRWRMLIGMAAVAVVLAALVRLRTDPAINVLLITLDTTRADRLGCFGYRGASTPILDQLASQGVLFERAYTAAPLTLPSHATMFTGLYPPEHGLRANGRGKLDPGIPTLSGLLSRAGYDAGAFVGSLVLDSKFGLDHGFAVYDDDLRGAAASDDLLHEERSGAEVVSSAISWLKAPRSRPFYCWVHLYDPHFPYSAHEEEFHDRFRDSPYDGELAYVDRQIGRLLNHLQRSGLDSNTAVVVVGDHGEGLGDHVEQQHGYTLYDSTQHVPLILRVPGRVVPGHRHPLPVSLVDLLPTLCELLGLKVPAGISGRSFTAALRGGAVDAAACYAATDDPYLEEGCSPLRSLTIARWKYIRTTRPELYDLTADPGEKQNLAGADAGQLAEMERLLHEVESKMIFRVASAVQLSSQERRALESLGYLGGQAAADPEPGASLKDVKDILQDDADTGGAVELLHAGKVDLAMNRLRAIVRRSPGHAASRYALAKALESQGDVAGAILQYEDTLNVKPDHLGSLLRLGVAQVTLGHLDEAVAFFNKALQIAPDSAEARFSLGRAYLYLGRFDEAVPQFEEVLRQDPKTPDIRTALGDALLQLGRTAEAVLQLDEEVRRNPRSVPARLSLAAALFEQQPERAFRLLLEAREIQPRNPHIHFQIGELLLARGRPAEALESLSETVRLMPDHPRAAAEIDRARQLKEQRSGSSP